MSSKRPGNPIPTPPSVSGHHLAEDGHPEMDCPPVYVLTGGPGASGQQILHGVLAQFPNKNVPIETLNHVRSSEEIDAALDRVAADRSICVHTMIEPSLRRHMIAQANARDIPHVDLMGPLLDLMAGLLGEQPLGEPGRYYRVHADFFERVEAIEYTLRHDDGKEPAGWPEADVLILGVSRSGKTPVSVYLADLGWKVVNIPLVPGIKPHPALGEIDRRRVFGLEVDHEQLLHYRRQRQRSLGTVEKDSDYTSPVKVIEDLEGARKFFKLSKFTVIDVTNLPVEAIAAQIIQKLEERYGPGKESRLTLE